MITPLYGQLSPLRIPTNSRFISADSDVSAYILAVEAADGQQLEEGVITAVETFVLGCKSDGIWSAIKASCILAGARTLSGALVPLAGTSPTNFNFVSGDYNRETGLIGNASTKYLNTNRKSLDDAQNNNHQSVYITNVGSDIKAYLGFGSASSSGSSHLFSNSTNQARNRAASTGSVGIRTTGFLASSRNTSTNFQARGNGSTSNFTVTSTTPTSLDIFVFSRNVGSPNLNSDARLSYYSIGESLNLALLDTRVSNLMTALAAAIP